MTTFAINRELRRPNAEEVLWLHDDDVNTMLLLTNIYTNITVTMKD